MMDAGARLDKLRLELHVSQISSRNMPIYIKVSRKPNQSKAVGLGSSQVKTRKNHQDFQDGQIPAPLF
jgi:hypothetical protein